MAANLSPSHTEPQFGTTFQQRLQFEQPGHFSRHLPDQQSNNLIMINQFSIIDIHHHHCPQNYDSVLNQFKNISSAADDSTIGTFSDKQMANSYSCADSQPEIAAPLPSPMSSYNSSLSSNLSSNKMNDSTIRIDNACKLLAISADPYNWNQTDVQKWLIHQQRWHQLIPIFNKKTLANFQLDGMALCELTMQDFYNRILSSTSNHYSNGSSALWHCANILYNELNIWRTAITSMEPDLAFFDLEQQSPQLTINNHYDFPVITANSTSSIDNDSKSLDPYCSPAPSPSLSTLYSYQMYSQDQQLPVQTDMNVYGNEMIPTCSNNNASSSIYSSCSPSSLSSCSSSPCSPAGSSHSSMSPNTNYGNQQSNISVNHITCETNHLDMIKCGYSMSNNQCDVEINTGNNYYGCTVNAINHSQQTQSPLHCLPHPQMIAQHQQTSDYGSDGAASDDEMSDDDMEQFKPSTTTNHQCMESFMQSNNYAMMKLANSPSIFDAKCRSNASNSSPANHRSHSSSSIQLWQFLKELLAQPHLYGTSIRWLERSGGVFKIEDSVRVARLWGQRKNRPAMNYDKLSRSIRQYYKKGIMKKTERAQRLVYQFCQPYSL